jgi:hypothetical protein
VGLGDPRASRAGHAQRQAVAGRGRQRPEHIVKTTTYLIDPRYREPVYQEVGKWLKGVFPISTGLVVSALGQPQWLMEIDVIAVIPEKQAYASGCHRWQASSTGIVASTDHLWERVLAMAADNHIKAHQGAHP